MSLGGRLTFTSLAAEKWAAEPGVPISERRLAAWNSLLARFPRMTVMAEFGDKYACVDESPAPYTEIELVYNDVFQAGDVVGATTRDWLNAHVKPGTRIRFTLEVID